MAGKTTAVKKDTQEKLASVKVRLSHGLAKEKYGHVPKRVYVGGASLVFSQDEQEVSADIAELLKSEGLIE
jgi:hypothetical protein